MTVLRKGEGGALKADEPVESEEDRKTRIYMHDERAGLKREGRKPLRRTRARSRSERDLCSAAQRITKERST
jgi:hypothetical protein